METVGQNRDNILQIVINNTTGNNPCFLGWRVMMLLALRLTLMLAGVRLAREPKISKGFV